MTIHCNRGASSLIYSALILASWLGLVCAHSAVAMEPDIPKIQAGAERGSIAEEIELGAAFLTGRGVARDPKQAAHWYERAANSGDAGAQLEIGYFYQAGIGVDRNPTLAAKWFERAASSGLSSAKVNLGVAYVWGTGVRRDPEFAAQLFREAAKKGDGAGACYLGDMYYFGLGVERDVAEARHWFERGSKLHSPMAKFNLAMMLLGQENHARDREAMKLLRESSEQGYVRAQHQLGLMMIRYPALEGTPGEGTQILERAAAEGSWKSSVILGILARDGKAGIPQDRKNAYYRFRVAVLQGGDSAAKMLANDLQKLQSQLSPSDTSSLNAEAADWVSKHDHPLQFANMHVEDPQNFPSFALGDPENDAHAGMLIGAPTSNAMQDARKTFR